MYISAFRAVLCPFCVSRNFVPNISFGPPVISCLRKHIPDAYLDVHLMTDNPKMWLEPLAEARVNSATFHWESIGNDTPSALELGRTFRGAGLSVGLAIKPKTPIEEILPILHAFDLVLIMTVEPGFGGQSFMVDMMEKVSKARKMYPTLNIQVNQRCLLVHSFVYTSFHVLLEGHKMASMIQEMFLTPLFCSSICR